MNKPSGSPKSNSTPLKYEASAMETLGIPIISVQLVFIQPSLWAHGFFLLLKESGKKGILESLLYIVQNMVYKSLIYEPI